jgi:thiol-disulfide isomerase/thioredoxin
MPAPQPASPCLLVACLCAQWCGTCREYRTAFDQLAAALPQHRWRWLDIEDEAELADDLDIETFPTLLVVHAGQVRFAGTVLPRAGDAQRLIESVAEQIERGVPPPALTGPADQDAAWQRLARLLWEEPAG